MPAKNSQWILLERPSDEAESFLTGVHRNQIGIALHVHHVLLGLFWSVILGGERMESAEPQSNTLG